MSIHDLTVIEYFTKIPIEEILKRMLNEEKLHRCIADDLTKVVCAYILRHTEDKNMIDVFNNAIYLAVDEFDKGYTADRILFDLYR